ncbi:GNAT family N-acetyltransferase [Streptomyces sp. NPDC087658]|uniref:GNAT family N-acetyltransferase n=1 Tax=Streptomyces sp. NPDC087658 TaxID=3365800 RepID=UPI00381648DE
MIVLAPSERGKGYAAEAARLTLDWAFHIGALRMVWLKVLEPNRAGIAVYEKAGFPAVRILARAAGGRDPHGRAARGLAWAIGPGLKACSARESGQRKMARCPWRLGKHTELIAA